ncbi:MAG: hypothetical protein HQK91_08875 [Nitrospirae bacterium]|nr:hypothetical protein [Nitrospirota bacterium]
MSSNVQHFDYAQSIKSGIDAAWRVWQTALIRLIFFIFSVIGMAVIIGIVLTIGWVIAGVNIHELRNFGNVNDLISLILGKYFTITIVTSIILLFYIMIVLTIALYIFGGSCGCIALAIKNPNYRLTWNDFIFIGKKTFFTLIWFITLFSLLGILCNIILVLDSTLAYRIVKDIQNLFIDSMIVIFTIIFNVSLVVIMLSLFFYGTASIYLKENSAKLALTDAFNFFKKRPSSIWFIFIIGVFYALLNLVFILISLIIAKLPTIGFYISIPFNLIIYFIQSILNISLIGSIFYYYGEIEGLFKTSEDQPAETQHEITL